MRNTIILFKNSNILNSYFAFNQDNKHKTRVACNAFVEWVRNDRPRIGGIFDRLKVTRKDFISDL